MADTILNKLKVIRSNFSIGLFSFCLIQRLKPEDLLTVNRCIVGEDGLYCVPQNKQIPEEAGNFYEVGFAGSKNFNISKAAMELAKMLLRNFTLDSFEAIKSYCDETGQLDVLHRQSWYQFTRMIRNSLTHTQY